MSWREVTSSKLHSVNPVRPAKGETERLNQEIPSSGRRIATRLAARPVRCASSLSRAKSVAALPWDSLRVTSAASGEPVKPEKKR